MTATTAKTSFRGSFTALVTPFKNGSVDEASFRALVDWQIAEGTQGLVPVGTTGESPTLSHEEHNAVVEWCVDQAKGRVPVVAGAGSNSTKEAIALARHAEERRRRCRSGRHAVLQQADPGRALSALQGDQRRDRHSDHHLQHPAAVGGRHVGRHHDAAVRTEKHRRRQGRHGELGAGVAAARGHGRGLQPALRRGRDRARLHGAWRPWLHLGHLERRAAAVRGIPGVAASRATTPAR